MNLTHTITTTVDRRSQEIRLEEVMSGGAIDRGNPLRHHHMTIISLREQAVRDALVSLGWTPPLHSRRENEPELDPVTPS